MTIKCAFRIVPQGQIFRFGSMWVFFARFSFCGGNKFHKIHNMMPGKDSIAQKTGREVKYKKEDLFLDTERGNVLSPK